ncbi:HIT-like domain-containing protein [Apodospora peruviana]|uniref:HIT-like domain-containing protein n=1 Tax=Apodospora peruviana TaxID=516989 RepID=A0AAE0HS12_9PEZI|nr:HIT-like domain-containing protein [Apodospora peruviana]
MTPSLPQPQPQPKPEQPTAHTTTYFFRIFDPIVPGHVLVSPRRVVERFTQLTDAEAADLFVTAKRVARTLERVYSASGLTVPLQDGFGAGQSVPHVRIHLLPRHPADFDH